MKTLNIGRRVEKMLAAQQLDIAELSRRTGLDLPFLESLLADDVYPSIGPLLKVARAPGVRLGTLVDDQISQDPLIVRHGGRSAELHMLRAKDRPQTMRFYSLGRGKTDRHMEPFYVELLPELRTQPRGYLSSKRFPHLKRVFFLGQEMSRAVFDLPPREGKSS